MKEYKVIHIGDTLEITEKLLNDLAKDGWELVCSYAKDNLYLILERNKGGWL